MSEPVHLSDWASQPNVRIKCDQSYGVPAYWNSVVTPANEDGEGGVYRREDGKLYTFTASSVTCLKCQVKRQP